MGEAGLGAARSRLSLLRDTHGGRAERRSPARGPFAATISLPLTTQGTRFLSPLQDQRGRWQAQGRGALPEAQVTSSRLYSLQERRPWSKFPSGLPAQLCPEWPVRAPCTLGRRQCPASGSGGPVAGVCNNPLLDVELGAGLDRHFEDGHVFFQGSQMGRVQPTLLQA